MPIFEYKCKDCNNEFEALVFGSEKPDCPSCKSPEVEKQLSICGFVSKGADGSKVTSAASSGCSGCSATSCGSCTG